MVAYLTSLNFMPDYRRSGVRITVGKKKFVYIYRRYLINAIECSVCIVDYHFSAFISLSSVVWLLAFAVCRYYPCIYCVCFVTCVEGQFHTKRTLQNSHSIWMHSVTKTRPIFPLFAFKVMHTVILLTRFCKLLTTVAVLSGPHVPQVPQWHDASAQPPDRPSLDKLHHVFAVTLCPVSVIWWELTCSTQRIIRSLPSRCQYVFPLSFSIATQLAVI